jgi:hypothetical protein
MDLLQKDVPILTKIYEAKCLYDSQNNRIILYYKNRITGRTLVDFYNPPTTPPPNSSLYVIYDLQTGIFNVSTDPPTYTVSNSKVYVTSPINAEYDMDKVIIYRISWRETDTDIDLNYILEQLNTFDNLIHEQQENINHILEQLNTLDNFVHEQQENTSYVLEQLNTLDNIVHEQQANINHILEQLNTFVRKQQSDTITATHTFDPTQPGPAFQLGPNAQNQLIRYLNADKVDGFDVSQTPAPNVIPITNAQSVIPQDFLPLFTPLSIPYSQLYIQSSAPSIPYLYDSWYNIDTNELFYWNGSVWIKVDWIKWVQNDIWFRLGKLRITNGSLEISNNGTNWYRVFPVIGRVVEVVANDTNSADNFKIAYLTVGQTLLVRGRNLARAAAISPSLWVGNYYHTYVGGFWFGIFPSNIAISDGYGQWVTGSYGGVGAYYTSSRTFVPITEQANEAHNWAHFSVQIFNNRMTTASVGHGHAGPCVTANIGSGSFPSNGYFLGSFCYEGTRIDVDYLVITRQG